MVPDPEDETLADPDDEPVVHLECARCRIKAEPPPDETYGWFVDLRGVLLCPACSSQALQ